MTAWFFSNLKKGVGKTLVPASVVAVLLAPICLDRVVFPLMESKGVFWGRAWSDDEKKLFKLSCLRNWASKDAPLFRNHLIKPREPRTGPRILVMGDSFVWGDGYRNVNDIWWRQLSRELIRRGYKDVEVLGAGYPGFSTSQELSAARKLVADLKPDLIIWGYTENDPDEGVVRQSFDSAKNAANEIHTDALARALPNLAIYLQRQIFSRSNSLFDVFAEPTASKRAKDEVWELQLLHGENWNRFSKTASAMSEFLRQSKTKGIVVALPETPDVEFYESCFRPAQSLFEQEGVPFLDLAPEIVKWHQEVFPVALRSNPFLACRRAAFLHISPANAHPSAAVTQFYAAGVADFLEKNYRSVLGEREPVERAGAFARAQAARINDVLPIFACGTLKGTSMEFDYPDPSLLLKMPLREPFVQVNFETPVYIKTIDLSGPSLQAGSLHLTTVDPQLGFDNGIIKHLGRQVTDHATWEVPDETPPVNSIMLAASFKSGNSRHLVLNVVPRSTQ